MNSASVFYPQESYAAEEQAEEEDQERQTKRPVSRVVSPCIVVHPGDEAVGRKDAHVQQTGHHETAPGNSSKFMNTLHERQSEDKEEAWNKYDPKVFSLGPPERERFVEGRIQCPSGKEPDRAT